MREEDRKPIRGENVPKGKETINQVNISEICTTLIDADLCEHCSFLLFILILLLLLIIILIL